MHPVARIDCGDTWAPGCGRPTFSIASTLLSVAQMQDVCVCVCALIYCCHRFIMTCTYVVLCCACAECVPCVHDLCCPECNFGVDEMQWHQLI